MLFPQDIDTLVQFSCNICGQINKIEATNFHREGAACINCGSVARFRGIVTAVSEAIFGKPLLLPQFPSRKDIRGIGMSDSPIYASGLEEAFDYKNTFFHQEPFFDVTSETISFDALDFVICTEVLEHVGSPVLHAFENMHRTLRKGGKLIFSVPYSGLTTTLEHYGERSSSIQTYEFAPEEWIVVQKNGLSDWRVFGNPIFHGGPGTTLEMRVFGLEHLLSLLDQAGFRDLKIYDQPLLNIGYYWAPLYERVDLSAPILGYVMSATA